MPRLSRHPAPASNPRCSSAGYPAIAFMPRSATSTKRPAGSVPIRWACGPSWRCGSTPRPGCLATLRGGASPPVALYRYRGNTAARIVGDEQPATVSVYAQVRRPCAAGRLAADRRRTPVAHHRERATRPPSTSSTQKSRRRCGATQDMRGLRHSAPNPPRSALRSKGTDGKSRCPGPVLERGATIPCRCQRTPILRRPGRCSWPPSPARIRGAVFRRPALLRTRRWRSAIRLRAGPPCQIDLPPRTHLSPRRSS